MKNNLLAYLLFFLPVAMMAQKAWIDPDPINPEDSVTIFIDIKKCECQSLLGTTEPVYLWTWLPAGDEDRDAEFKNGQWTSSNLTMEMKSEGNDVWSFKMIPTEFYNVDAATVYDKDFHFLAKSLDGTGAGGGGCDEAKTEDLSIAVDPPTSGPIKVRAFPDKLDAEGSIATTQDDVFTLIYDNKAEDKVTMQNNDKPLYVYARANLTNGNEIKIATLRKVDETPELQMTDMGDGVFHFSIIPSELFKDLIPAGQKLDQLRLQIVQEGWTTADQTVDGIYTYVFVCD